MENGRKWDNIVLSGLDPEKIMSKFSIEDCSKGLRPEYLEKYFKKLKHRKKQN